MKKSDIVGKKFGRLVVLSQGEYKGRFVSWNCLCECGKTVLVQSASLNNGNTKSCGCYKKDKQTKHSMTFSKTYRAWAGIKQRCFNKKHKRYADWGGRGISMCERWNDFRLFYEDMGERPSKDHSIDRIDNDKGYNKKIVVGQLK